MGTKNKLSDLNNHLFEELERLNDDELKGEALQEERERAKTIYEFAENQLLDGFNRYFKNNYEEHTPVQIKNDIKKDYAYGFVRGLKEKFEKQKEEETKKNEQYALVVTNQKVREHMENLNFTSSYKLKNNSSFTDPYAFINGREKGKNMKELQQCIES